MSVTSSSIHHDNTNQQHVNTNNFHPHIINGQHSSITHQAGDIIHVDYRNNNNNNSMNNQHDIIYKHDPHHIRIIQWNIERGYKLPEIITLLSKYSSDIISLQEIDIMNERSQWKDTAKEIAAALHMNCIFLCEFEEIYDSQCRNQRQQGGGLHGNAVLCKYDIHSIDIVKHKCQPYNWNRDGHIYGEPRRGERMTLAVTMKIPCIHNDNVNNNDDEKLKNYKLLRVYNAHFELFCGLTHRLHILSDIYNDVRKHLHLTKYHAILGDFNTLAHSIARLSSKYCKDHMRYCTVGYTEPEWLCKNVLNVCDEEERAMSGYTNKSNDAAENKQPFNDTVYRFTHDKQLAVSILNPHFYDPYDMYHDVTIRTYHGLFQGKLDYILLRYMDVHHQYVDNHDYDASDHKLLCCDVAFSNKNPYRPHKLTRPRPGICTYSNDIILAYLPIITFIAILSYLAH